MYILILSAEHQCFQARPAREQCCLTGGWVQGRIPSSQESSCQEHPFHPDPLYQVIHLPCSFWNAMACKCSDCVGVLSRPFSKSKHCYKLQHTQRSYLMRPALGPAIFLILWYVGPLRQLFNAFKARKLNRNKVLQLFWHILPNKSFTHQATGGSCRHRAFSQAHHEMLVQGNFNENRFSLTWLNSFTILALLSVTAKKLINIVAISELNQLRDLEYGRDP